jgi:RHS repeat-associated protein
MLTLTRLHHPLSSLSTVLAAVFVLTTSVAAQVKQYTENKSDLALRSEAHIDPATHGMSVEIPLGGAPGRGGNSVPISIRYSSKLWRMKYTNWWPGFIMDKIWVKPKFAENSWSGWTSSLEPPRIEYTGLSLSNGYESDGSPYNDNPNAEHNGFLRVYRIHLHLPDGSSHELRKSDAPTAEQLPDFYTGTFYAVDGTGMRFDADNNVLYLRDGSRYFFAGNGSFTRYNNEVHSGSWATQYIDANGNTINYSLSSVTDTLGRSWNNPLVNSANKPTVQDQSYSVPGVGGTGISYTLKWAELDDSGVLASGEGLKYTSNTKCLGSNSYETVSPYLYIAAYPTYVCGESDMFNPVVLKEVVTPTGSYTFQYNSFGEIVKITFPTGGYERFAYGEVGALSDLVFPYDQANRGVLDRWVSPTGNVSDEQHWNYTTHGTTAPDGSYTVQLFHTTGVEYQFGFSDPLEGKLYEERSYDSSGQMMRRSLTEWEVSGAQSGGYWLAKRDPRVIKQVELLLDTGGNAQAAATTTSYDADLNPISTNGYDFASISSSTAQTGAIGSISLGTLVRTHEITYLVNDTSISSTVRQSYRDRQLLGLPSSTRVKDGSGTIVAQSEVKYDESGYSLLTYGSHTGWTDPSTTVRGLPTTTRSWLNTTSGWVETHVQYDQCGSPRNSWDANGNQSQVAYSSTYYYAYPTSTISPDPDGGGGMSAHTTSAVYDFTTGRVIETTDPNSVRTTFAYGGSGNRLSQTIRGYSTSGVENQTTVGYDDTNRTVTTTSDLNSNNDNLLVSKVLYDGLGRTVETRQYEGGSNYIAMQQHYNSLGRVFETSNPFRPGESVVWTTTYFDALGRVVSVSTPDGATVSTSYSGSAVTVTDQAGKQRKSVTDGLGRLTAVYEDPNSLNYQTIYSYDVLDNLRTVSQDSQTRTFEYDSLKRLTSAANPESGTVYYGYDSNGNLTSRVDARSITTTLTYDALNRLTSKTYNDSPQTPRVDYYYDSAGMPSGAPSFTRGSAIGRLVAVTYGGGSAGTYRGYDELGRVVLQYQQTDSVNYKVEAAYNRASGLASQTYPSVPGANDRRTVTYTPDAAGRLASLTSNATTYAAAANLSGVLYKPHGGVETETLGNGLIHQQTYNNRLQTTAIKLGTSGNPTSVLNLTYDYGTTNNNGNVQSHVNTIGTLAITEAFTYDPLNRLLSTTETSTGGTGWTENNHYDQYGNRSIDLGGGTYSLSFNASNRISTKTYDSAGNLTVDGSATYGYDAENHLITVNSSTAYAYDGAGRRVKKLLGETTRFIYDTSGELIAEFNASSGNLAKEYVSGAGMMAVIDPSAGTRYSTVDHLGSPRVVTNSSGAIVSRHDYRPFGVELVTESGRTTGLGYGASDGVRDKFTGYERDSETGLDFAQARYYASTQGRFTSSDPLMASGATVNPKTWNRYAYALNNPLRFTDPTGLRACEDASCSGDEDERGMAPGELEYEQRLKETFDKIAAKSKPKPQKTLVEDNPGLLQSEDNNSGGSNISVIFFGSYDESGRKYPNGESTVSIKDEGDLHGLGFTVAGSVPEGESVAPDSNSEGWRLEQHVWNYEKINGRDRVGGYEQEKLVTASHEIKGNTFRWWDHPGIPTWGISSYERRTNFVVKVIKGKQQSEVKFHFIQTFINGKWSVRWGEGNY